MTLERQFYAIAPTQFGSDGTLDAVATAENLHRAKEVGVDRFLLTGAYGEFQSLDDDERVDLVETARKLRPDAVIMAGAAHPSTDATLRLAKRLVDAGADEVMVGPPSMTECTDLDAIRHFGHLDAHCSGTLVLYNNPAFGWDASSAVLAAISDMPVFGAVKQGTGSIARFVESVAVARQSSSPFRILAASDLVAVATLSAGADGLTSTNFWAFPQAFCSLGKAVATTEHQMALKIQEALAPFFEQVRALGQPRAIKAAMSFRGFAGTPMVRLPFAPLSDIERRGFEEVIRSVDAALESIGTGV